MPQESCERSQKWTLAVDKLTISIQKQTDDCQAGNSSDHHFHHSLFWEHTRWIKHMREHNSTISTNYQISSTQRTKSQQSSRQKNMKSQEALRTFANVSNTQMVEMINYNPNYNSCYRKHKSETQSPEKTPKSSPVYKNSNVNFFFLCRLSDNHLRLPFRAN